MFPTKVEKDEMETKKGKDLTKLLPNTIEAISLRIFFITSDPKGATVLAAALLASEPRTRSEQVNTCHVMTSKIEE